jgi:hypothetical protein
VPVVEIITLGHLKAFNFKGIYRFNNCVNSELVMEVLVKLAISTAIVMVARPEFNTTLHTVQAWPFPGRALS